LAQGLYNLGYKIKNICNNRTLLHGDFSHVAMYIGSGVFIEAYPGKENGVRLTKYTNIFDTKRTDKNWKVYRNSKFHNQHSKILSNIEKFLEKRFEINIFKDVQDTYFCSKLIYHILKDIDCLDLPYFKNLNEIYPDHFYTMVTQNKSNYWTNVTSEYKLNEVEKSFIKKLSWIHMRNVYGSTLDKTYKTDIRFHQLTDGRISNWWWLKEKIDNGEASEEEIKEFDNIKDEDISYSYVTILFNCLACFRNAYES